MALLTRAQWQAAASIPRSLNDSRKWLELHLAEYRRQTAVLVKNFSTASDDKIAAFEEVIQRYVVAMEKVASSSHGHLAEAEKAARQIKFELERGVAESKQELKKIRNDIQDERIRLEKARRDMEARMTWQERFQIIFVLAGFVFLGFLIGRHLIR
jgi:ABC-type nitrate/sulfonate/bicarbonate transport system substrate-binding protein